MSALKDYGPRFGPGYAVLAPGQAAASATVMTQSIIPLTAAQIIAMGPTPITIIPAPATGKAIIVEQIIAEITLTSTAFTGGQVVHLYYHGQSTEIMAQAIAAASITGGAGTTVLVLNPVATAGGSVVTTGVGIDITTASNTAFAAGTGSMKLYVRYRTITL